MISTTNLLLRHQARKAISNISASSRHISRKNNIPAICTISNNNLTNKTKVRCFSAEPIMDEKPLIPGIGRGKTSTGLVGLDVDHDAVPKMIVKYQALLDKLNASDMPPDAQYRINVEKIARFRIKAAQENLDDPEKVEELCNCGQVEELVIQADNEMIVMNMYLKNRWWELVKPVEIEYDPEDDDGGHGDIEWGEAPEDSKK